MGSFRILRFIFGSPGIQNLFLIFWCSVLAIRLIDFCRSSGFLGKILGGRFRTFGRRYDSLRSLFEIRERIPLEYIVGKNLFRKGRSFPIGRMLGNVFGDRQRRRRFFPGCNERSLPRRKVPPENAIRGWRLSDGSPYDYTAPNGLGVPLGRILSRSRCEGKIRGNPREAPIGSGRLRRVLQG